MQCIYFNCCFMTSTFRCNFYSFVQIFNQSTVFIQFLKIYLIFINQNSQIKIQHWNSRSLVLILHLPVLGHFSHVGWWQPYQMAQLASALFLQTTPEESKNIYPWKVHLPQVHTISLYRRSWNIFLRNTLTLKRSSISFQRLNFDLAFIATQTNCLSDNWKDKEFTKWEVNKHVLAIIKL